MRRVKAGGCLKGWSPRPGAQGGQREETVETEVLTSERRDCAQYAAFQYTFGLAWVFASHAVDLCWVRAVVRGGEQLRIPAS